MKCMLCAPFRLPTAFPCPPFLPWHPTITFFILTPNGCNQILQSWQSNYYQGVQLHKILTAKIIDLAVLAQLSRSFTSQNDSDDRDNMASKLKEGIIALRSTTELMIVGTIQGWHGYNLGSIWGQFGVDTKRQMKSCIGRLVAWWVWGQYEDSLKLLFNMNVVECAKIELVIFLSSCKWVWLHTCVCLLAKICPMMPLGINGQQWERQWQSQLQQFGVYMETIWYHHVYNLGTSVTRKWKLRCHVIHHMTCHGPTFRLAI